MERFEAAKGLKTRTSKKVRSKHPPQTPLAAISSLTWGPLWQSGSGMLPQLPAAGVVQ